MILIGRKENAGFGKYQKFPLLPIEYRSLSDVSTEAQMALIRILSQVRRISVPHSDSASSEYDFSILTTHQQSVLMCTLIIRCVF